MTEKAANINLGESPQVAEHHPVELSVHPEGTCELFQIAPNGEEHTVCLHADQIEAIAKRAKLAVWGYRCKAVRDHLAGAGE